MLHIYRLFLTVSRDAPTVSTRIWAVGANSLRLVNSAWRMRFVFNFDLYCDLMAVIDIYSLRPKWFYQQNIAIINGGLVERYTIFDGSFN